MYCDFCGKQLVKNVKYCRHCGQMLRDRLDDTRPLPVITEGMLTNRRLGGESGFFQWPNLLLTRKRLAGGVGLWKKIYQIASCATLVSVIYILATFTTIKEYQILTTIIGSLLAIGSWQKGKNR